MTRVVLTTEELYLGANAGIIRTIKAIRANRNDNITGEPPTHEHDVWRTNIEGALGELAYCKWRGIYWTALGRLGNDDAGDEEIRTSWHPTGRLILYPKSEDGKRFVLIVGELGVYRITGWMMGRDGKREQYWSEVKKGSGRMAFMIPQAQLRPLEELP